MCIIVAVSAVGTSWRQPAQASGCLCCAVIVTRYADDALLGITAERGLLSPSKKLLQCICTNIISVVRYWCKVCVHCFRQVLLSEKHYEHHTLVRYGLHAFLASTATILDIIVDNSGRREKQYTELCPISTAPTLHLQMHQWVKELWKFTAFAASDFIPWSRHSAVMLHRAGFVDCGVADFAKPKADCQVNTHSMSETSKWRCNCSQ